MGVYGVVLAALAELAQGERLGQRAPGCSAKSYVSPSYENFFISEGTQTSEGKEGLCGGEGQER